MTRRFHYPLIFTLAGILAIGGLLRANATDIPLVDSVLLESNVVYLRVSQVQYDLATEITTARRTMTATNTIIGIILDLRFADGNDLAAAKAVANLFTTKKPPLAILINNQTRDAAAALAINLREARDGLILGGVTADLKPDIAVAVDANAEREFFKNPYTATAQSATNISLSTNNFSPFIDHTSEADLVRAKIKDGDEDEDIQPVRLSEPQTPVIHDPVLARAVDLIKALAVIRQPRA